MTIITMEAVFPDGETYGGEEVRVELVTGSRRPAFDGNRNVMGVSSYRLPTVDGVALEMDLEPNTGAMAGTVYRVSVEEYRWWIQVPDVGGPFDINDPAIAAEGLPVPGVPLIDHGDLTGLADDDHLQYLTEGRGDARYTTPAQAETIAADAAAAVVDAAPATLDTLNELAAALGDDPNFATTVTTSLAGKADTDDPRLSDARTPTAHAATHAADGTDPLTPGAIGAELAGEPIHVFATAFMAVAGAPSLGFLNPTLFGRVPVMRFDAAAGEQAAAGAYLPASWTTYTVDLVWSNIADSVGDVVWGTYRSVGADGAIASVTGGDETMVAAAPAVANTRTRTLGSKATARPANGLVTINVRRDAANVADTLPNDAALEAVVFRRLS